MKGSFVQISQMKDYILDRFLPIVFFGYFPVGQHTM
jgi:hypothetical protein